MHTEDCWIDMWQKNRYTLYRVEAMRRAWNTQQLAARLRFLERKYDELHSQVSGYLHGEDWEHWQKFNAARFNPPNVKDDGAGASPAPVHRLVR